MQRNPGTITESNAEQNKAESKATITENKVEQATAQSGWGAWMPSMPSFLSSAPAKPKVDPKVVQIEVNKSLLSFNKSKLKTPPVAAKPLTTGQLIQNFDSSKLKAPRPVMAERKVKDKSGEEKTVKVEVSITQVNKEGLDRARLDAALAKKIPSIKLKDAKENRELIAGKEKTAIESAKLNFQVARSNEAERSEVLQTRQNINENITRVNAGFLSRLFSGSSAPVVAPGRSPQV